MFLSVPRHQRHTRLTHLVPPRRSSDLFRYYSVQPCLYPCRSTALAAAQEKLQPKAEGRDPSPAAREIRRAALEDDSIRDGAPLSQVHTDLSTEDGPVLKNARRGSDLDGRDSSGYRGIQHLKPKVDLFLRSEEPPSELQSLMRTSYAVICLKKKKKK